MISIKAYIGERIKVLAALLYPAPYIRFRILNIPILSPMTYNLLFLSMSPVSAIQDGARRENSADAYLRESLLIYCPTADSMMRLI